MSAMNKIPEWNERWEKKAHLEEDPNPLLVRVVESKPWGRALDLACGAGRNALYLKKKGWDVEAIDGSEVAIRILRDRAKREGVDLHPQVIDLESTDFKIHPEDFDVICMLFYLQRNLFHSIRNGIRPGGFAIVAVHMKDDSKEPMNPAFLMEPGELKKEFEGWEIHHYLEGKSTDRNHERQTAEIIAKKP
jgi:SAM-dependent methyltransferase